MEIRMKFNNECLQPLRALFADYSKTFDRADRNTSLNKMATGVPKQ